MPAISALGIGFACLAMAGCAARAPDYQLSIDNVQVLQRSSAAKVSIGIVKLDEKDAAKLNLVTIRGGTVESPYGGYAEYLRQALQTDLSAAGKYDPNARRAVNAVMTVNRLDASGFNVGEAELAARFSVTEGGRILYDMEQAVKREWESSFLGTTARRYALQNYIVTYQKLVGLLFSDPAFRDALEK